MIVALVSMLISAGLAVAKIIVGMRGNSTAVVSDGFESATDVLSSGMVFLGLWLASRPADDNHPYGHGRVETLSALGVGIMLSATGGAICFHALQKAYDPVHRPEIYTLWPLLASLLLKATLWLTKRYYARRIRSEALMADSWNDAVDNLSAVTALGALGLTLSNPERFMAADHVGGFAIGLIVIGLGLNVVRENIMQLMDTMPDDGRMQEIRDAALRVPGALGIEKCFARKTGLTYHVDLHLEVDPEMSVRESHDIASAVRDRVKEDLDWVADVLVHVEPHFMPSTIRK